MIKMLYHIHAVGPINDGAVYSYEPIILRLRIQKSLTLGQL